MAPSKSARAHLVTEPTSSAPALLEELRELAQTSPALARKNAWELLERLSADDRRSDISALWANGLPPERIDGALQGLIMGSMWGTPETTLGTLLAKIHPTWVGKTFDHAAGTGFNRLAWFSRPAFLVIAAGYRAFNRNGKDIEGFRFNHSLETAAIAPYITVRALDYSVPEYNNPSVRTFPIARTRDEIVELVPGVFLGRALLTQPDGEVLAIAHFALRDQLSQDLT
ncbi:MAG: hypothetical protein JWQ74_2207 [Marmoricola sp.]|nr:hypothetical protein [Marmoricola sp.]